MSFDRSSRVGAALAAAYFVFLLAPSLSPHYGLYSDELYYLACTRRPALGYVDQPPLFVWVLWLWRTLFGDSQIALRTLPAAAGAATVLLTASMARRMGGGSFAQGLAALAAMMSIASLAVFSFFSMNALAILLWTAATWILVERCRTDDLRLWLALGAVLGLALLNKHTAAVPVAGVAVATLATPLRSDLRTRWPWLGALFALVLVAPNLGWQAANGWPSIAFYRGVEELRHPASALEQVLGQVVYQNPASLPIWGAGLAFFFGSTRGRRYRPLGWLFVTGMLLAILGGSRLPYRIAGIFPVAFAGGAVLLAYRRKPDAGRLRRVWSTATLPALLVAIGLAAASLILPVLPPPLLARHPLYDAEGGSGWRPEIGTNEIPYHLGNRTHWKAFAEAVAQVADALDPAERADAIVLADYFGHAGALEHYVGDRVPPVYSAMTGYYLWGPPPGAPQTVIAIGIDEDFLAARFEDVAVARTFRCRYCPPVVNELPIHVARRPQHSLAELWPEIGALPHRRERLLRAQRAE